jgi:Mn2+/Fe2+ NRAMP family transporter
MQPNPTSPPSTRLARADASVRRLLARAGPGLITGVADDDPSGIGTYAQAGAAFGFNLLWTMPLAYPLMAAIQSICARLGRVTGRGLAANLGRVFPPALVWPVVLVLLLANVLNIAADVAAMGEATELVTGLDRHVAAAALALVMLILQVFVPYHRYVHLLKWLTLSLLAYVGVLLIVHVPWPEVLARTVWPHLTFSAAEAGLVVAVFGTTISPYLFFWQASEEVEDMAQRPGSRPLAALGDGPEARAELDRIAVDTWSGMAYSNLISYAIILATAVTLHAAGVTDLSSAAEAAAALRPLAGDFAFALFAVGLLGVGLIGVPVLAGAGAYAVAEAAGWPFGLERTVGEARGFYTIIAVSYAAALSLQYAPVDPMRALVLSAMLNGVVAVPLMALILLLAARRDILGVHRPGRTLLILGWLGTALMAVAAVRLLWPD